jgi:hypothetical protein
MKFLLTLLLITSIICENHAQKGTQKAELLAYNVIFSGVTSGIGSMINSPKNKKKGKAFLTGFWQGSIGGVLKFTGKELTYQIGRNSLFYAWPARIVHATGLSICENAAYHRPFLENWHFYLGIVRIDFSVKKDNPMRLRFLPLSPYNIYTASRFGKFDLGKTLQTGSIIYHHRESVFIDYPGYGLVAGISFANAMVVGNENYQLHPYIIAHELVHEFQHYEYMIMNSWISKPAEKFVGEKVKNVFSRYLYADVPYFWGAYDWQRQKKYYYQNIFEFEAESSATNSYINRRQ